MNENLTQRQILEEMKSLKSYDNLSTLSQAKFLTTIYRNLPKLSEFNYLIKKVQSILDDPKSSSACCQFSEPIFQLLQSLNSCQKDLQNAWYELSCRYERFSNHGPIVRRSRFARGTPVQNPPYMEQSTLALGDDDLLNESVPNANVGSIDSSGQDQSNTCRGE